MRSVSLYSKKYALIAVAFLLAVSIVIYGIVVPTVVAKRYFERLDVRLSDTKIALKNVATGNNLPMFTDPDISLPVRQTQIEAAEQSINNAYSSLDDLDNVNHLAALPATGFTGDYRKATVRRTQALHIGQQGRGVLNEYASLLKYIKAYTDLQIKLDGHLDEINNVRNFDTLKGKNRGITSAAAMVRDDYVALQSLKPPADFAPLQAEASSTFKQAADGFDKLAAGLRRAADSQIYSAANNLERVTLKNQINDKDLLVATADSSPTLRQLAELPEKVDFVEEQ